MNFIIGRWQIPANAGTNIIGLFTISRAVPAILFAIDDSYSAP